jgi:hypothetical protein
MGFYKVVGEGLIVRGSERGYKQRQVTTYTRIRRIESIGLKMPFLLSCDF